MKIVSYNINGIRASEKLGLLDWIETFEADVYCLQEVRCSESLTRQLLARAKAQLGLFDQPKTNLLEKYFATYNCGEVAGYAGTLILSKKAPDKVLYNMGELWTDNEGRTTTTIFGDVAIVNAYIPNGNSRLEFKMQYLKALTKFLDQLEREYKVICVGDFNIAHNEIDLTNPKECKNKSVFLPIEREAFGGILALGLVDAFRHKNPDKVEYSWRSYRSRQDSSYKGWKYRIDYALVSDKIKDEIASCEILDLAYSDHLPVVVEIERED